MKTKKKKNRIILCLCSIFILVASVFSFIPIAKESKQVYADTVYDNAYFRGSPITFTTSMYEYYFNSSNSFRSVYPDGLNSYQVAMTGNYSNYFPFLYTVFTVHMRYNANGVVEFLPMFQHPIVIDDQGYASDNGSMILYNYSFINVVRNTLEESQRFFNGYIINGNAYGNWFAIDGSTGVEAGKKMIVTMDASSFNGGWFSQLDQHLSGILFYYTYSSLDFKIDKIYSVEFYSNTVKYFDVDGNWLQFTLSTSNYYSEKRTYYFANNLFTDNEYYQSGYDSGYDNGYLDGEIKGQDSGYTSGYQSGKNDGYNLGYNQALENGQRYTFTNLIASVIDVPVQTFTSLFNFEILGVNLSGFFLGLLTCCIVIGVIRLIL